MLIEYPLHMIVILINIFGHMRVVQLLHQQVDGLVHVILAVQEQLYQRLSEITTTVILEIPL